MTPSPAEYQEAVEWIAEVRRKAKEAWAKGEHPRQRPAPREVERDRTP